MGTRTRGGPRSGKETSYRSSPGDYIRVRNHPVPVHSGRGRRVECRNLHCLFLCSLGSCHPSVDYLKTLRSRETFLPPKQTTDGSRVPDYVVFLVSGARSVLKLSDTVGSFKTLEGHGVKGVGMSPHRQTEHPDTTPTGSIILLSLSGYIVCNKNHPPVRDSPPQTTVLPEHDRTSLGPRRRKTDTAEREKGENPAVWYLPKSRHCTQLGVGT